MTSPSNDDDVPLFRGATGVSVGAAAVPSCSSDSEPGDLLRFGEPVAVVGIGCRFGGGVKDKASFWSLLENGVDAFTDVPSDRFSLRKFYDVNKEKRSHVRGIGVEHVFNSRSLSFADRVREVTKGRGVDVVLNASPGEVMRKCLGLLAPRGRMVEIGKKDFDQNSALELSDFIRELSFMSFDLDRQLAAEPKYFILTLRHIRELITKGDLPKLPTRSFPACDVEPAMRTLSAARHVGKLSIEFEDGPSIEAVPSSVADKLAVSDCGWHVVSGGTSGFGCETARWLQRNGAKYLALLSRRGATEPGSREAAIVEAISRSGADVRVMTVDISKPDQVSKALTKLAVEHPIVGIYHAAGVLADGPLSNQTKDTFARCFEPKIHGCVNLHDAAEMVAGDTLQNFVLFSSISAIVGNKAQANYAAANAFMDAFAHYRTSIGLCATSVNWGAIGDAEMVARDSVTSQVLEDRGIVPLDSEDALKLLGSVMATSELPQVGIADLDWALWGELSPRMADTSRFDGIVSMATKQAELASAHSSRSNSGDVRVSLVESVKKCNSGEEALTLLIERVTSVLSSVLHVDNFDINAGLDTYGVDSLLAAELTTKIEADCGVNISTMLMMQSPSVTRLAKTILIDLVGENNVFGSKGDPEDKELVKGSNITKDQPKLSLRGSVVGLPKLQRRVAAPPNRPSTTTTDNIEDVARLVEVASARNRSQKQDGTAIADTEVKVLCELAAGTAPSSVAGTDEMIQNAKRDNRIDTLAVSSSSMAADFKPAREWVDPLYFIEHSDLRSQLNSLNALEVRNPYFVESDGVLGASTNFVDMPDKVPDGALNDFSSYNYLGLSGHPEVTDAVCNAVRQFGSSASASRIASGQRTLHGALERELADFLGTEASLVFSAGFQAASSAVALLTRRDRDLVLHDARIHSSTIEGAKQSGAKRLPFRHNDARALNGILSQVRHQYERVLIVVEGAYSMDGDLCDLPAIVEVAKKYGALLMVDEAHSFGCVGDTGRGVGEVYADKVQRTDVDIWMGTLSKAAASCGGYIAGKASLCRFIAYKAPGFVYSAGISPANAAAALAAVKVMRNEPERVQRLQRNAAIFRELAMSANLDVGMSKGTPVVPVIVKDTLFCLRLAEKLLQYGVHVQPIAPPAVERGTARLRFFITSSHTEKQISEAVSATAAAYSWLAGQGLGKQQAALLKPTQTLLEALHGFNIDKVHCLLASDVTAYVGAPDRSQPWPTGTLEGSSVVCDMLQRTFQTATPFRDILDVIVDGRRVAVRSKRNDRMAHNGTDYWINEGMLLVFNSDGKIERLRIIYDSEAVRLAYMGKLRGEWLNYNQAEGIRSDKRFYETLNAAIELTRRELLSLTGIERSEIETKTMDVLDEVLGQGIETGNYKMINQRLAENSTCDVCASESLRFYGGVMRGYQEMSRFVKQFLESTMTGEQRMLDALFLGRRTISFSLAANDVCRATGKEYSEMNCMYAQLNQEGQIETFAEAYDTVSVSSAHRGDTKFPELELLPQHQHDKEGWSATSSGARLKEEAPTPDQETPTPDVDLKKKKRNRKNRFRTIMRQLICESVVDNGRDVNQIKANGGTNGRK